MSLFSVKDLTLAFGDKTVIKNLTFQIEEKEIIGIYAPSGSGKTTLLNYISKNYDSVSYAFQDYRLLNNLSVQKNVQLVLEKDSGSQIAKEKAQKILKELNLGELLKQKAGKLSGGEKQRVSLARALVFPSKLTLLDECFNSLDQIQKENAIDVTKKYLLQENKAAIIVSHDKSDLEKLCTRYICL